MRSHRSDSKRAPATKAASLSHGEKRKLDLAILLCGDPAVVLLDEPTAGIAVEDVPEMMALIRGIHRDQHKTVLMVEHRMDLIMGLADRMAVMHHGSAARARHARAHHRQRDRAVGVSG